MKPLVVIVWLALGVFYWWLNSSISTECCESNTGRVVMTDSTGSKEAPAPQYPIAFEYSSAQPVLSDNFQRYRDSLSGTLGEDQALIIYGEYGKTENTDSEVQNIGLARAQAMKELMSDKIDTSRIEIASRLVDNIEQNSGLSERLSFDKKIRTKKIQEIEDRTLIYFPYNSFKRLEDEEIERYLKAVALRVNESGERVLLTGHTDSFGNASYNYTLGLSRATVIKSLLVRLGVPSSQIEVSSKGETTPIAPNSTEEGRSKNRRTELVIVKSKSQ